MPPNPRDLHQPTLNTLAGSSRSEHGHLARRDVLQLGAGLAALGLWPSSAALAQSGLPALDEYQPVFFSAQEWVFVLAATARLIPSDGEGPGAHEARVPVFIDRELAADYGQAADWYMVGPHVPTAPPELGWQSPLAPAEVYRQGIAAVDQWCATEHGGAFADLSPQVQDDILTALDEGEAPLAPELRDFFTILLANTKEGYLSDPLHGGNHGMQAWQYIGFPGSRAAYLEWIPQHNVRYPLGPVSISGERA